MPLTSWRAGQRPAWIAVPAAALVLSLAACTSGASGRHDASGASQAPATSAPAIPVLVVGAAPAPSASDTPNSEPVSYGSPVLVTVRQGQLTAVQVSVKAGGQELEGGIAADGRSWVSEAAPRPATTYQVVASVTDETGAARSLTKVFTIPTVPEDQRLGFSVTPDDHQTVGVGQPIVVRFLTPVSNRAGIEKAMQVTTRTKAGATVEGSWSWLSATEAHWRPKQFWTPGTSVTLDMRLAGVQASAHRWGRKDYSETFTIGPSHVTQVDAAAHRIRIYRDGKLVNEWLTGTGRKGLETYSGTYIVLGKAPVVVMDSCSARITCDKKNPDYYNEKEHWATRITASGTFLHAAGWDGLLGKANVSHGCVHLSDANAQEFYDHAVKGDVVVVRNTGRGPGERIATQDPGLYDWNVSWQAWLSKSALH